MTASHACDFVQVVCITDGLFHLQADAELAWQQERSNLETAAQTAQRRLQDLERVNAELQVHLDSQARAAAGQAPEKGALPLLVLQPQSHVPMCNS